MMTDNAPNPTATSGWVVFAAVTIWISAFSNLLWAITMLLRSDWIVFTPEAIIRFDLTTAGVILLLFALFQGAVAFAILLGELWARVLGIIGASLNLLAGMAFMSIYPAWAWLIILINGVVIYGLTVHGDEVVRS